MADVDVWSFEYPGHLGRINDPPAASLVTLAEEVHATILEQGLNLPVIYGHSMGGKVAFEVALLLEAIGHPVHSLVVGGSEPPGNRTRHSFSTAPRVELIDELVSMGGIPPIILQSDDFLNLFLEIVRGDYRLLETYQCRPHARLSSPIIVLTGDADATARPSEMPAWAQFTTARTRFVNFTGGHFFPSETPSTVAAELLSACRNADIHPAPSYPP